MYTDNFTALIIQTGAQEILQANQSLLGNIFAYAILVFVIFMSFVFPLFFIVPMVQSRRKNKRVLQYGEPAQAKILKIWDTGVTVNDNPQVGMLLTVYPEKNLAPFQAETKKIISRLHIPQIQTGEMLTVKYNPYNPSEVAVVL